MLSLTVDAAWISHSVSQNLQISFNAEFHTENLPFPLFVPIPELRV